MRRFLTWLLAPWSVLLLQACAPSNHCVFSVDSASQSYANVDNMLGLDSAYGIEGRQWTSFSGTTSARKLFLMANGSILATGFNGQSVYMARYLSNGSADPSFGTNGQISQPVDFEIGDVGFQSTGQIIAAGFTSANGAGSLVAVRFNTDGTPDTAFGAQGQAVSVFSQGSNFQFNALAIQNTDAIDIVGSATTTFDITIPQLGFQFPISATTEIALFRTLATGQPDSNFGSNGQVYRQGTDAISLMNDVDAAAVGNDGSLILAGDSYNTDGQQFTLIRFNPDGSLDTTFGVASQATAPENNATTEAFGVTIDPDGTITATGHLTQNTATQAMTARFNSSGRLDSSFGGNGIVIETGNGNAVSASAVLRVADRTVIGGYMEVMTASNNVDTSTCTALTDSNPNYVYALYRYLSNGSRDNDFGSNGSVQFDFSGSDARVQTLLQSGLTTPLLVGGYADGSFGTARLISQP